MRMHIGRAQAHSASNGDVQRVRLEQNGGADRQSIARVITLMRDPAHGTCTVLNRRTPRAQVRIGYLGSGMHTAELFTWIDVYSVADCRTMPDHSAAKSAHAFAHANVFASATHPCCTRGHKRRPRTVVRRRAKNHSRQGKGHAAQEGKKTTRD
jgi:glutamine synthetase